MKHLLREYRLLLRTRTPLVAVMMLALLSTLAVWLGINTIAREQSTLERIQTLQATDEAAIMQFAHDPGDAAYYSFQLVNNPPSALAFAATGQRDLTPSVLRIRALALEGQLYESETTNPLLSLLGPFDFAFVLVFLAPLVLIVLMHDLRSSEVEAGRHLLLAAMPQARRRLWLPRALSRCLLVLAAMLLPLAAGLLVSGASAHEATVATGVVIGTTAFWALVCSLVAAQAWRSATHAAALAAFWFTFTLVLPAALNLLVNQLVPVPSGAQIVRENREAVHDGWDVPKDVTMTAFFKHYPEWKGTPPITTPFHWKWYFAFQHLGDLSVSDKALAYRAAILDRDRMAAQLSWLSPPVALHGLLLSSAGTDTAAQLRFQDRIRGYHQQLREYYYPALFREEPFTSREFAKAPHFNEEDWAETIRAQDRP